MDLSIIEVNYITESFKFMFFGMSIVFIFLLLLIQIVKVQAFLINKFFSKDEENIKKSSLENSKKQAVTSKEIAIITAAILEFRK